MDRWSAPPVRRHPVKTGTTILFCMLVTIGVLVQCQAQPSPTAAEADAFASKATVPASRPFYMGFTPGTIDS